jgi:DNA-directed RNA polymerase subunit F
MKKIIYLGFLLFCLITNGLIAQESATKSRSDTVRTTKQIVRSQFKKNAGKLTDEEKETFKLLMKQKVAAMSPEEKKAFRDKMKKWVEEMTPEDRQEMRAILKKKYDELSPEEKKQIMEKMDNWKDSSGSSTPQRKRIN